VIQPIYTLHPSNTPLLISMPHNGFAIPEPLRSRMTQAAQSSPDTDWFLDRLYAFAAEMGIGMLNPHFSRYVIDLNRPADNANLYPGQDTTSLCPVDRFDSGPIYLSGQEPDDQEIQSRIDTYWKPYHQALQLEVRRLHQEFGKVLIFEAHSIAAEVPRFFSGKLPDLNFGTQSGQSCSSDLEARMVNIAENSGYSWVLNGRFKGGYITRAYHQVPEQIYTLQLELSQATYLDPQRLTWKADQAEEIIPVLKKVVQSALDWLNS